MRKSIRFWTGRNDDSKLVSRTIHIDKRRKPWDRAIKELCEDFHVSKKKIAEIISSTELNMNSGASNDEMYRCAWRKMFDVI